MTTTPPQPSTDDHPRPPTTTAEQDRTTAGQRGINFVWELTQAAIALAVTGTTLYGSAVLVVRGEGETAAFLLLSNAFFLVIGFYFGRTNHARMGDASGRPEQR